ncbi:MAG: hypothetical protein KC656_31380 [Myxococcales bacterium]|nr:hypothetical protein [Myxococcales bacterium]
MTDSTSSLEALRSNSGALVQLGGLAWLAASFFVMFALGDYEPGVGASGPGSGIGAMMFGAYFLACSIAFRSFIFYRLKVMRVTDWFGEDSAGFAHAMYGVFGVVFVGLGFMLLFR